MLKPGAPPVRSAAAIGGIEVTGVVSASGLGAFGILTVSLSSSDTNAAAVPSSVTVKAGVTGVGSKEFTITTKTVSASRTVTINAGQGATAKTDSFTVENR